MKTKEVLALLDDVMQPGRIKDYCPNGLQVEGTGTITKVVTGVTASEAMIDAAIAANADMLLVHHGYFWKGESPIVKGMKRRRLAKLLANDINLVAYHLPLDVHPEHGNNAQLGKLLGVEQIESLEPENPGSVVVRGVLNQPLTAEQLGRLIEAKLGRKPLINAVRDELIHTVAWCTGGGQGFIDAAADAGIDAFLSGEVSEQTIHSSREQQIDFFACGHHATERYGAMALGQYLAEKTGLDVQFIDIDNPA